MPTPPSAEEILDAARLAVASYFQGSDKAKTHPRWAMEDLRSLLSAYDKAMAKEETQRIAKEDK